MKKVTVIGHFGFGHEYLDGQTVKTKILADELERRYGEEQVIKIDTHGGVKTLFKAPFQVIKAFVNSKNIIMLPAHNGLLVYGRLLAFFKKAVRSRKIHYAVIGGWLPSFLTKRRKLAKWLKKFDGIYVETKTMKAALEKQGFQNLYLMPNCKKLTPLSADELVYANGEPYKLCTFSRVMKEKGIEDAVNAVSLVNRELGRTVYTLDIYGQIDAEQTEWFDSLKMKFPEYIRYGGLVPFDKSVEVLKNYFALLFPTYYEGEGFAGTLIDAFSAGVPVIASNWKYNAEIVNDNVGYVYPTGNQQALAEILKLAAMNTTMILSKKLLCLKESEKYRIDKAVQVLFEQIDGA